MRALVVLALIASWSSAGCSGPSPASDGGGSADGSVDAATGVPPPAEPMPPAPVEASSRACPTGWIAGEAGCAPFADEPTCGDAEAAIPGQGCVAIGSPCPSGNFAAPPAGVVVYVSATATTPGDGSASAPYDQISRALVGVSAGTTILLSKGDHTANVELPAGVRLRGACVAETTLRPATAAIDFPTVMVRGPGAEVSDLTIAGDRPGILAFGPSASITVSGVRIDGVAGLGLIAQEGTIDASDVIVRGVRRVSPAPGRGVDALRGGTLTLSRATIESTAEAGSLFGSGADVTLTDVLYRNTIERSVTIQEGAVVRLERVALLGASNVALNANNDGTSVTAVDLYIAGDPAAATEDRAISLGIGASLEATGLYVEHVGENALFVTDAGSTATVTDVHFSDVAARGLNAQRGGAIDATHVVANDVRDVIALASSEGTLSVSDLRATGGGRALRAQTAGSLTAARVSIDQAVEDAVQSSNEGTTVVVEDLEVRGGTPTMLPARGACAFSGSNMTVRRASLRDVVWGGMCVFDASTTLTVEDVDIADVHEHYDGTAGYGLAALYGTLDATRVRVVNARTMGIGVGWGARVTLRDVAVSGTRPEAATTLWGRALSAQGPNDQVTVERGIFEESIAAGVFAGGDSSFDLNDVVVRTTRRRDCASGVCIEEGGVGLVSYYGASIRVTGFLLTDNDIAGAQLGEGGELDLMDGVVSHQPVGVSIQSPGYDVGRLTRDVRYEDNGSNLDTDELPVPESSTIVATDEPPED